MAKLIGTDDVVFDFDKFISLRPAEKEGRGRSKPQPPASVVIALTDDAPLTLPADAPVVAWIRAQRQETAEKPPAAPEPSAAPEPAPPA